VDGAGPGLETGDIAVTRNSFKARHSFVPTAFRFLRIPKYYRPLTPHQHPSPPKSAPHPRKAVQRSTSSPMIRSGPGHRPASDSTPGYQGTRQLAKT
jgi:hypothetical protein